jgi:hypothetical protein
MIDIVIAVLALTIFVPLPFDELGSQLDCSEIEKNEDLYFGSGRGEWVQECRDEMVENLTGGNESGSSS